MPGRSKQSKVTNGVFGIPAFATEAEEAEWWFANRDRIGDVIAKHGRIVPGRIIVRAKAISIRVPVEDIETAKDSGIGNQLYSSRPCVTA
jgi:hypothetical protein